MPCCSGSPSGIFITLTTDQLDALEASALSGIANGYRVSLSGGAKSGSKEFKMDPQDILKEILYARRKLGLVPQRVTKTYGEFTGVAPSPLVPNEQV